MEESLYLNTTKLVQTQFVKEDDFEKVIKTNYKTLFGQKTIYLDLKNKIDSKSLGGSIPDGILFDLEDKDDIQFYLIEVELAKHSFFNHIFPQITKFFAFYKNMTSRNNLIERLFSFIKNDPKLEEEFRRQLGKKELYKSIKDSIENNFNILLILDDTKPELDEIQETYTDTWDKLVKIEVLNVYTLNNNVLFKLTPDFKAMELSPISIEQEKRRDYDETFHLEGSKDEIRSIYFKVKEHIQKLDPKIEFNIQKYYISIKKKKNFAFLEIRKAKINFIVMIPYEEYGKELKNKVKQLTPSVQKFYNGPCFSVTLENDKNINELYNLLEEAYKKQANGN